MNFHDFTPADVLADSSAPDIVALGDSQYQLRTAAKISKLYKEKHAEGKFLRLLLTADDIDENNQVKHHRLMVMYSAVVVQRTPEGPRLRKWMCPTDEALVGLPDNWEKRTAGSKKAEFSLRLMEFLMAEYPEALSKNSPTQTGAAMGATAFCAANLMAWVVINQGKESAAAMWNGFEAAIMANAQAIVEREGTGNAAGG